MGQLFTLDSLNSLSAAAFTQALGGIYEHSPWVAEAAARARPFATVAALHEAMAGALRAAPAERQLDVIRAHPELGSKVRRRDLTEDSQNEQGALGLDRLSEPEYAAFTKLNAAYRAKFSFPFIICVRRHTRDSILRQFERRLDTNDMDAEIRTAIEEIALIARLRLCDLVDGPGKPRTDGRLSTHVLDTSAGHPAAGMTISLFEIGGSARALLTQTRTNADGRTDHPLLAGGPLRIGTYELQFGVADYFAALGVARADPTFLDVVPVRFSIAEPEGNYHVPLLVTPWSYATYRGS